MSYKFQCTQCDFETDDKLSVEMCEKRHKCTSEGHKQVGLIFDFKVTHTKCDCGKETPECVKGLDHDEQQSFNRKLSKLVELYYI